MEETDNTHNGHRERLRKRFKNAGFLGFNDYEVVELVLTFCIPRIDVKSLAKQLIKKFGNLRGILNAEEEKLSEVKGMGNKTVLFIKIIKGIIDLYLKQEVQAGTFLNSTDKLEVFWQTRLSMLTYEVFEVAYLDTRYRLIGEGVERIEVGTIDRTVVYPRKVMASALRNFAHSIVLAHNHPGGKAAPSKQDIILTDVLIKAAKTLDIQVLDHIIIAGKEIFSFRRNGLIL